jgi:hypothetical protein
MRIVHLVCGVHHNINREISNMKKPTILLALIFSVMFSSISFAGCKVPSFKNFTNDEWTVDEPYYYEDSGLGFSFKFNSLNATGDLYVYDLGVSGDLEKDWGQQFKQSISDIFYRYQKKIPDAKLSDPMLVPDSIFSHLKLVNVAAFMVVSKEPMEQLAIVTMGMANGCFHKFRYTRTTESSENSEIIQDGLLDFSGILNSIHSALLYTDYLQ